MKILELNSMENIRDFLKSMRRIYLNSGSQSCFLLQIENLLKADLASKVVWVITKNYTYIYNPRVEDFCEDPFIFGTHYYIITIEELNIVEVDYMQAEKVYVIERAKAKFYENTQKECIKMLIDEMLEEG